MIGARQSSGIFAPLGRMVSRASAAHLRCLLVPGPELASAAGLDLEAAGLMIADSPRSANVLLIIGDLPEAMQDFATIAYAQMPRPRAVAILGGTRPAALPEPDASGKLSAAGLGEVTAQLRLAFSTHALGKQVEAFDAPIFQTRTEYSCPMHPEVVSNEPGSCPKCGMFLEPREVPAGTAAKPGTIAAAATTSTITSEVHSMPNHDHSAHAHAPETSTYTCPMHPEVTSPEPGSCPKCGMHLVKAGAEAPKHDHSAHAHQAKSPSSELIGLEPGFMSMIEMTEGTPRSTDHLQMEWITTPFGPFFPGLPGGLTLELTLDGDSVVKAKAGSVAGAPDLLMHGPLAAQDYVKRLSAQMPLAPISYALLACRAIEAAAKVEITDNTAIGREAALERERISSHLSWLAQLGRQLGLPLILREATRLHLATLKADKAAIASLAPAIRRFAAKLGKNRFLMRRLSGIAPIPACHDWSGPAGEKTTADGRLTARLDEISASLETVLAAPAILPPRLELPEKASGHGHARLNTPRGEASLHVQLNAGKLEKAELTLPSARHLALVPEITEQRELADALIAVASLDLSPWEIAP